MENMQWVIGGIIEGIRNAFRNRYVRYAILVLGVVTVLSLSYQKVVAGWLEENAACAAQIQETGSKLCDGAQEGMLDLVTGITAVTREVNSGKQLDLAYSFENVMVGQTSANKEVIQRNAVVQGIREQSNGIEQYSQELVEEVRMSEQDYDALLHIVEAEATGEGLYGKVLVANVIMNRVADERFPDSIYDVVWEAKDGVTQFSPTKDGRIHTVSITDETIEAVNMAINGEDYSQGALFFVEAAWANASDLQWFKNHLNFLFSYKSHEFYTYPG